MKHITDERLIQEKRLVAAKAFGFMLLMLWGILYYRMFVLGQDIQEYLDIFLLTIAASLYVTISNVIRGNYLTYREVKQRNHFVWISGLVASVAFVTVQTLIARPNFEVWTDYLWVVLEAVVFFLVWVLLQRFIVWRSEVQSNKNLED
jgi:Kef-type K+ transport system membrane component KefB